MASSTKPEEIQSAGWGRDVWCTEEILLSLDQQRERFERVLVGEEFPGDLVDLGIGELSVSKGFDRAGELGGHCIAAAASDFWGEGLEELVEGVGVGHGVLEGFVHAPDGLSLIIFKVL